jgi:type II secretion system protein G
MRSYKGFTLIELLIVIAIILILIAIALPNFLEAQIRAKVTRAKADMRTISIALESYYLDWGQYTQDHDPDEVGDPDSQGLLQLTTPLTYLPQIPQDPFAQPNGLLDPADDEVAYELLTSENDVDDPRRSIIHCYNVTSHGPNQSDNFGCSDRWPFCDLIDTCAKRDGWMTYSPTNGTRSRGELVHPGGELRNGSYCIDDWQHILGKFNP